MAGRGCDQGSLGVTLFTAEYFGSCVIVLSSYCMVISVPTCHLPHGCIILYLHDFHHCSPRTLAARCVFLSISHASMFGSGPHITLLRNNSTPF